MYTSGPFCSFFSNFFLLRELLLPGLSVSAGPAAEGAEDPGMEGGYRRQQPGEDGKVSIKQARLGVTASRHGCFLELTLGI